MPGSVKRFDSSDVARRMVGRRLTRIDRIFYAFDGAIEVGNGPLETHLDDGVVLLFGVGPAGDSLRVGQEPWRDPFEGELTPEDVAYLAEHGKWTRVPVSDDAQYRDLIGAQVTAVELLEQFDKVAGISLETEARTLWYVVRADEAHVFWARPLGYRLKARYDGRTG